MYTMVTKCHLLILSLSAAVVSFDESTRGSGVATNVSKVAGTSEVVLVLSKAVDQEVSVFVLTTLTEGSVRGLLNLICPLLIL